MILILSTPTDTDTQMVIDWLKFQKATFFRLNDEDIMTGRVSFNLNPTNFQNSYIEQNRNKLYFRNFKIVWLRKFGFLKSYEDSFGKKSDITRYVYSEFSVIRSLILTILDDKQWLFKRINMPTKLEVLDLANKCNLLIPKTLITSKKTELIDFFDNSKSIISKSIGDGKHIEFKNKSYPFYTQIISSLKKISNTFSPSLFQEYIDKKYELRVFFLDNKFYSMVIFSQNNEKTKIDFRNYDFENPNRTGQYELPKSVKKKLINLMNEIGLNTGSIDLIKSKDNKYYFLEVNPSGQFGMTSIPCNYNLHKKVANYLINKNNTL